MGYRLLGILNDPNSSTGGSNYDALTVPGPIPYTAPTTFFPVQTAAVDKGYEDRGREDEVRGRRGTMAPYSFRGAPSATFSARLYPGIAKAIFPRALGSKGSDTGTAPASVTSVFSPVGFGGRLPALNLVMVREDQIDYLWGCWVESFEVNDGDDGDATISVTVRALYHEAVTLGATTFTPDTASFTDPYAGVTLKAKKGPIGSLVDIDCLNSFSFSFTNNLSDDDSVRFCKGKNLVKQTVSSKYRYRHFPHRHKIGRQEITGSLGFGDVQPTLEQRMLITTADALQLELTGNPLGTTPAADELIRFTFHSHVLTGGGPDELQQDGEIKSSYDFSGHLDPTTSKDFETRFVDSATVALPA